MLRSSRWWTTLPPIHSTAEKDSSSSPQITIGSARLSDTIRSHMELERRSFLKTVGAGATLTSALFPGRVAGANERIRVGFIGLGRMGRGSLGICLKMPEIEVAGLCDVYQPNLA